MGISKHVGVNKSKHTPSFSLVDLYDIRDTYNGEFYAFGHQGSIGQILQLTPLLESSMVESDYSKAFDNITRALIATASPDVTICFHQIRTTNLMFGLPAHQKVQSYTDASGKVVTYELPENLIERENFLRDLADEGEVLRNLYFVSIKCHFSAESLSFTDKMKITWNNLKSFFTNEGNLQDAEKTSTGIKKRLDNVNRAYKTLKAAIKPMGMGLKPATTREEYVNLYREIFAPTQAKMRDNFVHDQNDENESVAQAIFAGVNFREKYNHMIIDDYLYQCYELDRVIPMVEVSCRDIQHLANLPMEFIYTVALSGLDRIEAQKVFGQALKRATGQADLDRNSNGVVKDPILELDRQQIESATLAIAQDGRGAIQFSAVFIPRIRMKKVRQEMNAAKISQLSEYIFDFKETLRQKVFAPFGQSEWTLVEYGQYNVLCASLPGLCNLANKRLKVSVDMPGNIPYLLPIYTQTRNDIVHHGFNHFFTDSMSVFPYQNFDPRLQSWATLCAGDMGMGKSVTLNVYLAMAYTALMVSGKPPILRVIEYGGPASSFFKMMAILKGQIIKFTGSKPPCIQIMELSPRMSYPNKRKMDSISKTLLSLPVHANTTRERTLEMIVTYYDTLIGSEEELNDTQIAKLAEETFEVEYSLIKEELILGVGECRPGAQKMNFLMSVFEIMLSNDPKHLDAFATEFSRDDVSTLIDEVYENTKGRWPRITDIVNAIDAYEERSETSSSANSKMAARLRKWTVEDGTYKMFDMPTNVDLSNDCIMFDLYGLSENPHLEAIYMLVITDILTKDMYEKQDRLRVVAMDEVWKTAKIKSMQDVLIGFFRLSRKYKFQPIMASQLLTDYYTEISVSFGNAIVSQTRNFIICGIANEKALAEAAAICGLDPEQAQMIRGLGIKERTDSKFIKFYSRFMMISKEPNGNKVYILNSILSPLEFEYVNSNKEDNAITKYYMKNGISIVESCKKIMRGEHIGDADLIEYLRQGNNEEAIKKCTPKAVK